jgi:hypothetical protein
MEVNKSTHTGIVVNNCANVVLDGIDIYNTSGGDIAACIVKSGSGTFAGGACGLTVRNLHIAGGNNTQPLISDQVCGVTVTGLSNVSAADLFLNWYSCPVATGANGRQSFGQIIGVQYQKQGENIAAASGVTPREGNLFEVTGTADIQTIEAFPAWKGRAITLVWTDVSPGDLGTGGNVRLSGGVTFSPVQWDAVTLLCTGATWFEGSPR